VTVIVRFRGADTPDGVATAREAIDHCACEVDANASVTEVFPNLSGMRGIFTVQTTAAASVRDAIAATFADEIEYNYIAPDRSAS